MARRTKPEDQTATDRQRRRRVKLNKAGYQQVSLYLPAKLVERFDELAAKRQSTRAELMAEAMSRTETAAVPVQPAPDVTGQTWPADLVAALSAMREALGVPKTKVATEHALVAHQKAELAYKAMPLSLRAGTAGKALSYWLGRLDGVLGISPTRAPGAAK